MVKCIKRFIQDGHTIAEGETYEGPQPVEDWMLSSFPAHFVRADAGVKAVLAVGVEAADARTDAQQAANVETNDVDAPPVDKMLRKPKSKK